MISTESNTQITRLEYVVLGVVVLLASGASWVSRNEGALIVISVALFLCMAFQRRRVDLFIGVVLVAWAVVNVLSYVLNEQDFPFRSFSGYIVRFMIPYFALKIVGPGFWLKMERILFVMVLATLPVFLLDLMFPSAFDSMVVVFRHFTSDDFYVKEAQSSYWHSFVYTHSGRNDGRNSGFMWEPGAFAMVLVVLISANWLQFGMRLSKRVFVYVVALLSTVSTAGYLALGILLTAYLLGRGSFLIRWPTLAALAVAIAFASQSEFIWPKIEGYWSEYVDATAYQQTYSDRYEVNRLQHLMVAIKDSAQQPIGYGSLSAASSLESEKVVGVSGIAAVLVMWGWAGLLFVVYSIYRFCAVLSVEPKRWVFIGLSVAILVVFFSNPIERNPLFFLIIFTPHVFTRGRLGGSKRRFSVMSRDRARAEGRRLKPF